MSAESQPQATDVRLSSARAVRLVAERELRTRLRSKAFRITTAALVVLVVAFAVVMALIGSFGSEPKVGLTDSTSGLRQQIGAAAKAQGRTVDTSVVGSEAAGRRQVADGTLDALVVGTHGARLQVVVDKSLDDTLRATLTAVAGRNALDTAISRLGGDPAQVAAQVARADVSVTALAPEATFDPQRLAVGSIAGILIYLALITTGQLVAMGVVEEKASRVVELLLATIRPWQLMAGKVLGIGLLGLIQVAAVGIAGVIAGQLAGSLDLSLSATVGIVVWLIVWFVLGFTLYSLVFAGLGALVSRQEDVGGVTAPATMLLVVGYVVGISVLPSAPDNAAAAVMSLLPVFSPTLMPMRLAMGAVPVWQVAVSLALAVAAIPLLVALAGRTYRNGVVRTGARVGLREALARAR
ncbi:MAG: ABC transporter permease [Nocardioidaceae bacterium]